jgi:hypothetical protein
MNNSRKLTTSRYLQKATVTGRGGFPLDMLRYDSCWPSSPDDVSKIHASFIERDTYSITLSRTTDSARSQWTADRWFSFGWALQEIQA